MLISVGIVVLAAVASYVFAVNVVGQTPNYKELNGIICHYDTDIKEE